MKITLIQPYYENIWESIGLGYIIGYCQKHRPDVQFQFYQGNFDDDQTIINSSSDSDIIGFSCTSPAFAHALRLSKSIKAINPKAHTVFGGWHPSAMKGECITDSIDQIVIGEGEQAFLDIINGERAQIVQGTKLGFQDLPFPDRKTIKNHRTVDLCESMNSKRITSFQGNRVCPVACIFCAEHIVTGRFRKSSNPIRSRDPEDILDEIEEVVKEYRIDYFKFVDATFDVSAKYVIDFCKAKIARGIDLEWEALIHPAFATEEMMQWLAKANCNQINIGCESGSDKVLRKVGKGTKRATLVRVFKWAKDAGIERRGFFILGMPNEEIEDLLLTDTLIDEIKPDVVGFTILCPYPGTNIYDPAIHKGTNWENTDEYSNDFWYTEHLTNRELHAWQAYFKTKYDPLLCERQEYSPEMGMGTE